MILSPISRYLFFTLLALLLAALLFGPSLDAIQLFSGRFDRSLANLWNAGHLFVFALAGFALSRWRPADSLPRVLLWLLLLLSAGVAIEFAQTLVGRQASLSDVVYNGLGASFGLALGKFKLAWFWRGISVAALLLMAVTQLPTLRDFRDELNALAEFPVLADFSHPRQLSRFALSDVSAEPLANGLQLSFAPVPYATMNFMYFQSDWRAFDSLNVVVDSQESEAFRLTCRLHDFQHEQEAMLHSDRYNRQLLIQPGLQTLQFSLAEVAAAPATRSMNMAAIQSLLCFTHKEPVARRLRLERIWLAP